MTTGRKIIRTTILLFSLIAFSSFSTPKTNDTVYISVKGEVYHSIRDCRGLKNVKSGIIAVSKSEAEKKYKRRPCKICINK